MADLHENRLKGVGHLQITSYPFKRIVSPPNVLGVVFIVYCVAFGSIGESRSPT